ncbi:MAG: RDD family protein [Planctomycetota bacterium]
MLALRRLAAYAIDHLLFSLWVTAAIAVVVSLQDGAPTWTDDPWRSQAFGALFTTLPFWLYFTWCEASPRGRTLGKLARGLRVRDARRDTAPSLGSAALRSAVKLIPWELGHTAAHQLLAAGLGDREPPTWAMALSYASMGLAFVYVVMLFVGDGRAPHDRIARTRVVGPSRRGTKD